MPVSPRIAYELRPERQYRLLTPPVRRDWRGTAELLAAFALSMAIWAVAIYAVWLHFG